jgi:hypothetical protein
MLPRRPVRNTACKASCVNVPVAPRWRSSAETTKRNRRKWRSIAFSEMWNIHPFQIVYPPSTSRIANTMPRHRVMSSTCKSRPPSAPASIQ